MDLINCLIINGRNVNNKHNWLGKNLPKIGFRTLIFVLGATHMRCADPASWLAHLGEMVFITRSYGIFHQKFNPKNYVTGE